MSSIIQPLFNTQSGTIELPKSISISTAVNIAKKFGFKIAYVNGNTVFTNPFISFKVQFM